MGKGGYRGPRMDAIFGTTKTSLFSTNAQSRFASVVHYGVLGPLRLAKHNSRCPCFSVVSEARVEDALEGRHVKAQKAL